MNKDEYKIVEVDPLSLVVENGFNPREAVIGKLCYELEPVKSTITSIKQAYKEGRRVDLIKVVLKEGRYVVRQGHCRTLALRLAIVEGADIPSISVVLLTYDNEIEEYLENIDGNRSNGLSPVGQAHALSQAVALGYSVESLAQRYQRSTTAIRNMLKILEMPVELQRLISMGEMKKTLAIEIMLRYSNDHEKVVSHLKSHLNLPVQTASNSKPALDTDNGSDDPDKGKSECSGDSENKSSKIVREGAKKAVTRSSLGIKRLSQKKAERLKSEFLTLTTDLSPTVTNNDFVTEIKISKQHKSLFSDLNCKDIHDEGEILNLRLNESKLKKLLAVLNDDSTVIVIPSAKVAELNEIRNMLLSNN